MFVGGQLLANRHQCRPRFNGERGGDFVHVVQLFLHSRSWFQDLGWNRYTVGHRVPIWGVTDWGCGYILVGRPWLGSGRIVHTFKSIWGFQLGFGTNACIYYYMLGIVLNLVGRQYGYRIGMVCIEGPCCCCWGQSVLMCVHHMPAVRDGLIDILGSHWTIHMCCKGTSLLPLSSRLWACTIGMCGTFIPLCQIQWSRQSCSHIGHWKMEPPQGWDNLWKKNCCG